MQTSDNIADLAAALAKAQGVMTGAVKDSANPFFKSKYADLESVWSACRKPLADNQLSVIQTTSTTESGIAVTTMLAHSSGQWIRDVLVLQPKDSGPQAMGSCISYGRRYALASMVGVYQSDDDAEAATGRPKAPESVPDSDVTKQAREYVQRFKTAFEDGHEQTVADLIAEIDGHTELQLAIWGYLPSGMRRQIKEVKERMPKRAA